MSGQLYFLISSAVLALLLWYPMTNLIQALSVRRLERKREQELSEEETAGQRNRARFVALIVAAVFAVLFNYNVFGIPQT